MGDRDRVRPGSCLSYPTPRKVDLDALDLPDQFPQRSLQLAEPVVDLAVSGGHRGTLRSTVQMVSLWFPP